MSEIDNKTEDKRAEQNKSILDLANDSIEKFMTVQSELPVDAMDMDRIIKVSNHFSGRVLLDDGKNTANIGLDAGAGGFNVTFIETVAAPAAVDDDNDDNDDDVDDEVID